ncbi:ATP-dependent helicase HrpB [Myxococcus sp. K15C18031901]|uniref:ATP-dependent helicase HrpB n=1 Tax=Myxococcus dinghuensis TaxID=2906761 RepID=UPI0020A713E5|nr:ATP-dependent helicase HrpB [Myxococcus dinghuensis]MCP3097612.1 ATP-dependent helicase HrpB [Myxococcus dinghuensis]
MAGPMAGISAAQVAQQKLQDQGVQQTNKAGASKFDGVLADKAQGAGQVDAAQGVNKAQATQRTDAVRQVETVNKAEKAGLNKVSAAASQPVTAKAAEPVAAKTELNKSSKATDMMSAVVGDLEKGAGNLEKIIAQASSGKQFTNAELLSLQASMYQYTQQLDLTSKVVEKATTGLKDVVKTQV